MADPQDHGYVDVLEAEHEELLGLLDTLTPPDWLLATPSVGWTVHDSVSHLAHTEELARDTATDGPRSLSREAARHGGAGVIEAGVEYGRAMSSPEVLKWFRDAATYNRAALRRVDVGQRVPWGLGMGWRAFVTARLMEAWAHGLDIRAAVGVPAVDTERLRHIAWLSLATLPYAFGVAAVEPPAGHTLRLELRADGGVEWTFGPPDATDVIRGPAGLWCRRAVQRIAPEQAAELDVVGPLAALAVAHARCFL